MQKMIEAPRSIQVNYSDWKWEKAWDWYHLTVTWRLTSPVGEIRYLKLAHPDHTPLLEEEGGRMKWARPHLPVPDVIDSGYDGRVRWLVTRGLPGTSAIDDRWKADPERLVGTLAEGLKRFHTAPVASCPFDFTLDIAIRQAEERASAGVIDAEKDFHEEFKHLTVTDAVKLLNQTRPEKEDPVVCHGDYCLPNILIEDWKATGFIDLGELGVADRWWDIAIAAWSVTWNLGPGLEDLFYSCYGIDPDPGRIKYYRLLYDMVC